MNYRYKLTFLLFFLTILSFYNKAYSQEQNQTTAFSKNKVDSVEEMKVLSVVMDLKEVRDISKYIDSISKGKSRVFGIVMTNPTKNENFYWVRVAERLLDDKEPSLTPTIFHFYVMPKTYEIKYYDSVLDKVIDLSTWRIMNKKVQ